VPGIIKGSHLQQLPLHLLPFVAWGMVGKVCGLRICFLAHVSGCSRGVRDDSRALIGEQIAGLDSVLGPVTLGLAGRLSVGHGRLGEGGVLVLSTTRACPRSATS